MIIFVHSSLPVGGAEVLRRTVAFEMQRRGLDFRVCLISGGGEIANELARSGVQVDVLKSSNSIYNPLTTLRLAAYLRQHRPKIVQSSQFNSNFHTRIAAKIAGGIVVICEEHGLNYWKKWWHRVIDRCLVTWCDRIIAVCNAVKRFNIDVVGIPGDKIVVLMNCIDTEMFSSLRTADETRRGLGLANKDFVFGHVGTFRNEKSHAELLQAFANVRKNCPAKLLLIGDGPLKKSITDLSKELTIEQDVVFAGLRSDVAELLSIMDVFVLPSNNEAFSIALLEAMYAGLAVVASRVGGLPDLVDHGETGLLVTPRDIGALTAAMMELMENHDLRNRLGDAARRHVIENHTPGPYVDRLLGIYQQLMTKKALQ